ncbi:MAG: hypothetical protein PHP08_00540 [Candidatus Dojkabacteria bacterium]|nr:hypothetical protein [Candidatus Dojkabacteria bacterium]
MINRTRINILTAMTVLLLIPIMVTAIEPQQKDIYLDTKGQTGRLIYTEQYYTVDSNNNLTLDQGRIYFDGVINNSKITFTIIRPLDSNGNRYPESKVLAIATLDGRTILYTWYAEDKSSTSIQRDISTIQMVGLGTVIIIIAFVIFLLIKTVKRIMRKQEE